MATSIVSRRRAGSSRQVSQNLVTSQELEGASLCVAQATSALRILGSRATADADLQNALGLVTDSLAECAKNLGDLSLRGVRS